MYAPANKDLYVRWYGRPGLFVTSTSNLQWNDCFRDRQLRIATTDIVSRVFHLKVKKMMELAGHQEKYIWCCKMFFLLHTDADILFWMEERMNDIDKLISAEIPDRFMRI